MEEVYIGDKSRYCVKLKPLSWFKKHCFWCPNGDIFKDKRSYLQQKNKPYSRDIYIYKDEIDFTYTNVIKIKGGFQGKIENTDNNNWTDIPNWAVKEVMTIKTHPEHFI